MSLFTVFAVVFAMGWLVTMALATIFAAQLPLALRIVAAISLVPVLLFCGFGFLATFEPLEPSTQLAWRVVYSLAGVLCLAACFRLLFAKRVPIPGR